MTKSCLPSQDRKKIEGHKGITADASSHKITVRKSKIFSDKLIAHKRYTLTPYCLILFWFTLLVFERHSNVFALKRVS